VLHAGFCYLPTKPTQLAFCYKRRLIPHLWGLGFATQRLSATYFLPSVYVPHPVRPESMYHELHLIHLPKILLD